MWRFLCCECLLYTRARYGLRYALASAVLFALKSVLIAQLPLSEVLALYFMGLQVLLVIVVTITALRTMFGGVEFTSPGSNLFDFFGRRRNRFVLLWFEPGLAFLVAILLCVASLEDYARYGSQFWQLSLFHNDVSLMLPGVYRFWSSTGGDLLWLPAAAVPFISAIALHYYNRRLYERSRDALVDTVTKPASQARREPPRGATIAGSAIGFPKVSAASSKVRVPSLEEIGRSFR